METLQADNLLYYILAGVIALGLFLIFVQGVVFKFSVKLCGGDEIGFFYSLFVLWVSAFAGGCISFAVSYSAPDISPLIPFACGLAGTIGAYCLMLHMGPFRAFGLYVLNMILSVLSMGTIVAMGVGILLATMSPEMIEQLKAQTEDRLSGVNAVSFSPEGMAGFGENSMDPDGANFNFENLSKSFGISSEPDPIAEPANEAENASRVLRLEEQVRKAMFGIGSGDASNNSEGSSNKKQAENSAIKKKVETPIQSPYDNKIRTNPFVK